MKINVDYLFERLEKSYQVNFLFMILVIGSLYLQELYRNIIIAIIFAISIYSYIVVMKKRQKYEREKSK